MRGSLFVATAWGRQPIRPFTPARMGQEGNVVCDDDVCRIEPPPDQKPTTTPPASSEFPIVPVAVGAGALLLAAILLRG